MYELHLDSPGKSVGSLTDLDEELFDAAVLRACKIDSHETHALSLAGLCEQNCNSRFDSHTN